MSFGPELHFEGYEKDYINEDRLQRIVKFQATGYRSGCSSGEMLNALIAKGVEPEDIVGIYKVSPSDSVYSVLFKFTDIADLVVSWGSLLAGKASFDSMKLNEQVVNVRVHWLPLFYDNSILREILSDYGEILEFKMLKAAHEKVVVLDGVREVKMRVDEVKKHAIPHIVHFNSGQSVLLTMAGRPPYCLKCKTVGHVRGNCPTKKSYATTVQNVNASSQLAEQSQSTGSSHPGPTTQVPSANASAAGPEPALPPVESASGSTPVPQGASADPEADTSSQDLGSGGSDVSVAVPRVQELMEATDSGKRGRDEDDDDDFIKPNRTAKMKTGPPPSPALHLPLSGGYRDLLGDVKDTP